MEKKTNPLKNIKKYIFGKGFRINLTLLLLTLLLVSGINLITPQVASMYIDSFTTDSQLPINIYTLLTVLAVLTATFATLQTFLTSLIGEQIAQDLRNRLYEKILKQEYEYLYKTKPSKILTVLLSDINYVKTTLVQTITTILTSLIMITGSIILMLSIDTKIALLIILTVPTTIAIIFVAVRKKFALFKKVQKARDRLNKVINENVKGSMLIRVFVSEQTEQNKFNKANEKSKNIGQQIVGIFATVIPLINGILLMGSLIVIYFGGRTSIGGALTYGEITALSNYVFIFTFPILSLGFVVTSIGQAMASLNRINEILDSPITFKNGKEDITKINNLKIENLNYTNEKQKILKDLNFEINKGEKVGIIGLTGSGKTTFIKQLIRSLEPTKGKILINNKDIKQFKIENLRKLIGITFQENFLINDTIKNNILFGNNLTHKELDKILKISNVDEIIEKLPEGLNSKAGEQGSKLSGGQKQRIMIARALATNPKLLIMDDATSRLDIATEKKIFEEIKKNYPDITIITISQKIYSLTDCDKIYVMENGTFTHNGTHKQLLNTSPLYKEIEVTQRNYGK